MDALKAAVFKLFRAPNTACKQAVAHNQALSAKQGHPPADQPVAKTSTPKRYGEHQSDV